MGCVEGKCPSQEADCRRGSLVGQDLDIGKPGGVVDADVDELPAGPFGLLGALLALAWLSILLLIFGVIDFQWRARCTELR